MKIKVLGSAAGGGFPQWNCSGPLSRAVREGQQGFKARTQSSIAASIDGEHWVIFNASPDLRQQIAQTPELHPQANKGLRNSPIEAVILTNADVDHIAGLLNLREREPFMIYAHERILEVLAANSIFNVLNPEVVERRPLAFLNANALAGPEGPLGLTVEAFPVPGKVALFLEDEGKGDNFGTQEGDTIGVKISNGDGDQARSCYYIPGCAAIDASILDRIEGAGCLLFDGTVFTDTEMPDAGIGTKTGQRMGHIAINGPHGSLSGFAKSQVGRKIFIHINNTNPILQEGSPAERRVRDAGWEIAHDGMEIEL